MRITKYIRLTMLLITFIYSLNACSSKEGSWDDIIELSQNEVNFSSKADSIIISTQGEWWWISSIRLNDEFVDFENVNTTLNSFSIVEEEFEINRKDSKELEIKMSENITQEERELVIGVQAGNYFDNIKIIQEGE